MNQPLLHHRSDGPGDAPPLLLGPSLGTSLAVWEPQVGALARQFKVVRWDLPGHGGSAAQLVRAGASVGDLGRLVLALADSLGVERFSYAGISLGGAVGAWLAVHHPARVERLALVCSAARFGTPERWHERAELVRREGVGPLVATAPARWFTPGFDGPAVRDLAAAQRAADPAAYAACCDALAAFDLRDELGRIAAPTLVVAGRADTATPPADARLLADSIPDAALVEIPHAAHLAGVEQPGAVLAALQRHFGPGVRTASSTHADGTVVRREVLGDAHVDRSIAATTPFTARFQDFITRYAWGEIWTGDTLDRRTRSCITLTALVAGGHHDELAMHVRAAVRGGLSHEEIGEVLLQSAVYCGVPAANAAFGIAQRVLNDIEEVIGTDN
ncbi:3-oxoadipate enol-lactonase [Streptomyces sp. NPDC048442]|uniref:bifunctional 3-oxoadipate enol-lactonase/4-carboxymuconolactone decarboxylase PcaDC n=1 Tax=Streptomyces sp. NPDC048442 TaxID=3154823 RepID=UPI00344AF136